MYLYFNWDRNEGKTNVIQRSEYGSRQQIAEISKLIFTQIQYLKELLNLKRKGMSPDDVHLKLV